MKVTIYKSAMTYRKADQGVEAITYEVIIDQDELARMARKAVDNKSQQKRSGPIQVKILSTKALPATVVLPGEPDHA